MTQQTLFDVAPSFVNRSTKAVTFQGKLDLPIHRWYRLTPSFSPRLAADIAHEFGLNEKDFVLDPFSGVGTVPLCMKYRGIPSCSVELNPYLHFVGVVKTRTYRDVDAVSDVFHAFIETARDELSRLPDGRRPQEYLAENAAFVPPLHNIRRWWSSGNLAQLVCLRKLLLAYKTEPECRDLLRMGLLAILIPVSNAKHNHVSLTFAETPLETVDVGAVLQRKYAEMLADLRTRAEVAVRRSNGPSREQQVPDKRSCRSPGSRRPSLRRPLIPTASATPGKRGPTCSSSTSSTARRRSANWKPTPSAERGEKPRRSWRRGVKPKNDVIRGLLRPYLAGMDANGGLMASYVVKYFNDMYDHAAQVAAVCANRCRLAYVIGNSKFYGHPLPSDEILASIFRHFGFRLDRIDKMRKRQSKSGLYEAVVFMSR